MGGGFQVLLIFFGPEPIIFEEKVKILQIAGLVCFSPGSVGGYFVDPLLGVIRADLGGWVTPLPPRGFKKKPGLGRWDLVCWSAQVIRSEGL